MPTAAWRDRDALCQTQNTEKLDGESFCQLRNWYCKILYLKNNFLFENIEQLLCKVDQNSSFRSEGQFDK